jgi:hypothetical protein
MKVLKLFIVILFVLPGISETSAQWVNINFSDKYQADHILSFKGNLYVSATAKLVVDTSGIFKSTDKGKSWARVSDKITAKYFGKLTAFTRSGFDYIFADSDSGVFCSVNEGQTWVAKNKTIGKVSTKIAAQIDGNLYASTYLHTYRSADMGESWQEIFFNTKNRGTGAIIKKGNFLLATMVDGSSDFLFKSTDNGLTWNSVVSNMYQASGMALLGDNLYAACGTVLLKSHDDGLNCLIVSGLPAGYNYLKIKAYGDYLFCVHLTGIYFQHKDSTNWHNTSSSLLPVFFSAGEVDENYIYASTFERKIWRRPITDVLTEVEDQNIQRTPFTLNQNYPNPFTQMTEIKWRTSEYGQALLKVYDFAGREIKTIVDEKKAPGEHQVTFDASGLPAGVYFYQLQVDGNVESKKMIVSQ